MKGTIMQQKQKLTNEIETASRFAIQGYAGSFHQVATRIFLEIRRSLFLAIVLKMLFKLLQIKKKVMVV